MAKQLLSDVKRDDGLRSGEKAPQPRGVGLTRRLAGLGLHEAHFSVRGFKAATTRAQQALEDAGIAFIRGYNCALEMTDPLVLAKAATMVERCRRGLFMEGAAMGFGIRDAMPWHIFSAAQLPAFLDSVQTDHPYLPTVGAGWAMARLPWRRSAILGSLDTLLSPLALDGWGFHDCYFGRTEVGNGSGRNVVRLVGAAGARSWDQGAGRALWFISGGSIADAVGLINRASPDRHPDLYAGLGLALTYAGGIDPAAAKEFRSTAGRYGRNLAQGAAFALEAHVRASTDHSDILAMAAAITGRDADSVVAIVRSMMPTQLGTRGGASSKSWVLYERWRTCVAEELEVLEGAE
ncbi:DUF1702 family protein [Rhizobium sp. 1AS11]|uniref:DUF1702 family protein n=1 Tax=Rhizobium acaciae TaxID=2989736 RepID=UPI0022215EF3|nr:DUF1702 family protein [Rhizobium acaciae]MCW1408224.1 DUF1702 family protein [Rhizobium acaciae]MCW1740375.1 DUF1702 family protein [Rhizobium acaciae]